MVSHYDSDALVIGFNGYDSFGVSTEQRIQNFNAGFQYLLRCLSPDIEISPNELYNSEDGELFFSACPAEGLLGCARLIIVKRWNKSFGYIEDVVVRPEFRVRGIATALLDEIKAYAETLGLYKLVLVCEASKTEFYANRGFAKQGIYMRQNLPVV